MRYSVAPLAFGLFATTAAIAQDVHGAHSGRFDRLDEARAAVRGELIHRATGTSFDPAIQAIVDALTLATFDDYLRGISGDQSITVGGQTVTIDTRYTGTSDGDLANDYAYEQTEALGFEVEYQTYDAPGGPYQNVIARLPGTVNPNHVYVLGAHLDSTSPNPTSNAPGAEDNGSGSSALLAAAHALSGRSFENTIELVWFTGEEQGLWGSAAYVSQRQAAGVNLLAAVTFDMISYWNDDYGVLIEGDNDWEALMQVYADAVDTYTAVSRQFSYFSFGSDHVSFQNRGIPAILAIDLDWASYPGYHRTTDTYDRLDPTLGHAIARAGLAAIAQLADPVSVVSVPDTGPATGILAVRPNPTDGLVTITLVEEADAATVEIFDLTGRLVKRLQQPVAGAVSWDLQDGAGRRVSAGVYWIRVGDAVPRSVVVR
jgi:hypothetical protein